MDYVEVEQARDMTGLRLVLTAGVPGPWGESAKAILKIKAIDYVPVRQDMAGPNEALVQWTGHRNAPILVMDGEPPRTGWAEILMAAERLKPQPALVPSDLGQRTDMMGLCHLVCGERGFGWDRRLIITRDLIAQAKAAGDEEPPLIGLLRGYGYTDAEAAAAPERCAALMRHLADRLRAQERRGSPYFFGDAPTALDIYWACFSQLLQPMPEQLNPMSEMTRGFYQNTDPTVAAAADPILIRHRDTMYERHIGLPLSF